MATDYCENRYKFRVSLSGSVITWINILCRRIERKTILYEDRQQSCEWSCHNADHRSKRGRSPLPAP